MAAVGRKPKAPVTRTRLLRILKSWHLPVLSLNYIFWNNSLNAQTIMPLWLKSFNTKEHTVYTVPQINHYPMPITVCANTSATAWSHLCAPAGNIRHNSLAFRLDE
jgi:ACS family pantothenate transporter-like MFS transporter